MHSDHLKQNCNTYHEKCITLSVGNALSDDSNYDFNCTSKATLAQHDPPLLYDLSVDPGMYIVHCVPKYVVLNFSPCCNYSLH